jgi:putative phosphoribosyl transferase
LAERLLLVTTWLKKNRETSHRKIGYFGASTGAAAALIAAVLAKDMVHAVVSRGGRADLAGDYLRQVQAPTLLLVGGLDQEVIVLNKQAY